MKANSILLPVKHDYYIITSTACVNLFRHYYDEVTIHDY
jgi:hypothetical protein